VCLSACLSLGPFPHYCTDPDVTWEMVGVLSSCALLADLQSVHGFRCYGNIPVCKLIALYAYTANAYSAEREMSASDCTRCIAGCIIYKFTGMLFYLFAILCDLFFV